MSEKGLQDIRKADKSSCICTNKAIQNMYILQSGLLFCMLLYIYIGHAFHYFKLAYQHGSRFRRDPHHDYRHQDQHQENLHQDQQAKKSKHGNQKANEEKK